MHGRQPLLHIVGGVSEEIGRLRTKNATTPALILSALGAVDDRVRGLRAGGDDYLPVSFSNVGISRSCSHIVLDRSAWTAITALCTTYQGFCSQRWRIDLRINFTLRME
jgi:hypothetical protein